MAAEAIRTSVDMADLDELAPLSKRLQAATTELNQALQTIQDRLNTMGIGVEVWVSEALRQSDWRETDRGRRVHISEELGYGRIGDGWALLVRTRTYVDVPDGHGDWDTEVYGDDSTEKPLLRAARELRIAAVPLIPKLVDALRDESSKIIAAVENAKKIAEGLK